MPAGARVAARRRLGRAAGIRRAAWPVHLARWRGVPARWLPRVGSWGLGVARPRLLPGIRLAWLRAVAGRGREAGRRRSRAVRERHAAVTRVRVLEAGRAVTRRRVSGLAVAGPGGGAGADRGSRQAPGTRSVGTGLARRIRQGRGTSPGPATQPRSHQAPRIPRWRGRARQRGTRPAAGSRLAQTMAPARRTVRSQPGGRSPAAVRSLAAGRQVQRRGGNHAARRYRRQAG